MGFDTSLTIGDNCNRQAWERFALGEEESGWAKLSC